MPESTVRKAAAEKKKVKREQALITERTQKARAAKPMTERAWVPPTFITVGLLGVIWLVVYYIAGSSIPAMASLGNWNMLIGMGLMAISFFIMTLWR